MTDPKIELCPFCENQCTTISSVDEADEYHIWCLTCLYHSGHEAKRGDAIAAHNELCEYVRLGKAAKKAGETLATLADELGNHEDLMDSLALADRAEAFCKNPPKWETSIGEYPRGYNHGIDVCCEELQEKGGE